MDGQSRVRHPPLEVRREFVGSRLESQVLIRAYDLAVPTVRRHVAPARPQPSITAADSWTRAGLMAQGA